MLGEPPSAIPLRPLIQASLDHGGNALALEDLYAAVLTGAMQLWLAPAGEAALFTEIIDYPRLRALHVVISAGKLNALKDLTPVMLRWARDTQHCTRAQYTGRPGWLRILKGGRHQVFAFCDLEDLL